MIVRGDLNNNLVITATIVVAAAIRKVSVTNFGGKWNPLLFCKCLQIGFNLGVFKLAINGIVLWKVFII